MTRWRIGLVLLLGLVVWPLLWPVAGLFWGGLGQAGTSDLLSPRLWSLARNTLVLVVGVMAVALPLGVLVAVLLERTDLPGRKVWMVLLVAGLFIPLPLWLSGWQTVLGVGGWLPWSFWQAGAWAPWALGIGSAVWVHSLASLPWVVLLVGYGLRNVEPELEEDALLVRPPAWVIWRVSLPRTAACIGAAGLWLAMQTTGEITVTDLMQVRTFAEEVYTQLSLPETDPTGGPDPLDRAVAGSLLLVGLVGTGVIVLARQADRFVPAGDVSLGQGVKLHLGAWRWPLALLVGGGILAWLLLPVLGLTWRAGLTDESWSLLEVGRHLARAGASDGWLLLRSLLVAGSSGVICGFVALVGSWLARESRWLRAMLLIVLAIAWAMPGPVVGLGLKGVFQVVVDATAGISAIPAHLLWYGPSSLPLVVVYVVRFLPFACALLWPAVRLLPTALLEASRLDGATPGREMVFVVWPQMRLAFTRAALAVAILSLGELSAGKLVSTPGGESYAEAIWTQMHYGVTADLAAQCLLLLGVVLVGSAVICASRLRASTTAA